VFAVIPSLQPDVDGPGNRNGCLIRSRVVLVLRDRLGNSIWPEAVSLRAVAIQENLLLPAAFSSGKIESCIQGVMASISRVECQFKRAICLPGNNIDNPRQGITPPQG